MSWLRSIQGQLSELANEVLTEATEEVADPESELQVATKKCAEAERLLVVEQTKCSSMEKKIKELEDQLFAANFEIESVSAKYTNMVQARDEEIKKIKIELEQLRENSSAFDVDETEERIADLEKEVIHWKQMAKESSDKNAIPATLLSSEMNALVERHNAEIADLKSSYEARLTKMKEEYEGKLSCMSGSSSSTSHVDLLDVVMLEKNELTHAKNKLEDMANTKTSDDGVLVYFEDDEVEANLSTVVQHSKQKVEKLTAEAESSAQQVESLQSDLKGLQSVSAENAELTLAYNELNEEFERYKEQNGTINTRNQDLVMRIDYLKANIIEYEERYEICKKENASTVQQLKKLTEDFEALSRNVENSKTLNSSKDKLIREEVDKLQLLVKKTEEEKLELLKNYEEYQSNGESLMSQLEDLKALNAQLFDENAQFGLELAKLKESTVNCSDMEEYKSSVATLNEQIEELKKTNAALEEQVKELEQFKVLAKTKDSSEPDDPLYKAIEEQTSSIATVRSSLSMCSSELVASMTAQLREALAAASEKTEECDSLRATAEDIDKELQIRQSCVEDLIVQNNQLQVQYQEQAEEKLQAVKELAEKERAFLELERELIHLQSVDRIRSEENYTTSSTQTLMTEHSEEENTVAVLEGSIVDAQAHEIKTLRSQLADTQTRCSALMEQVNTLRETCEKQNAICDQLSTKMADSVDCVVMKELTDKHAEHLQALNANYEASMTSLKSQNETLVEIVSSLEKMTDEQSNVIESLKQSLQEADGTVNQLTTQLKEYAHDMNNQERKDTLNEEIASLRKTNDELRQVVVEKHSECESYYERLQSAMNERNEMVDSLAGYREKCEELEYKYAEERKLNEKKSNDLSRLKEHLLLIEETSTADAISAEKRETELLARINSLQMSKDAATEGVTESTQHYQSQLAAVSSRLEIAERNAEEWRAKFISEERERQQTAEALSSLQVVVRELASDHEKETATSSHRNLHLTNEVQAMQSRIKSLEDEMERLSLDKLAAEEKAEAAHSAIATKQRIIDDLEIQLEETRAPRGSSKESYRIDDSTLRQLFMNYFTAENDKKPDIALLLARILEYPPEDVEKIRLSVRTGSHSSTVSSGISLSEQFIRFLENESESARTAPHLPVAEQSAAMRQELPVASVNTASGLDAVLK